MTLDQDEQLFVDALQRSIPPHPDLSAIALRATRSGARLRHRHQARAAVATLAAVGVGVGGTVALAAGGHDEAPTADRVADSSQASVADPTTAAPVVPSVPPALDTSSAYAVLDLPGWVAPLDNVIADEKLYYVQPGTDASVSLNWRPASPGTRYTLEELQADLEARYGGDVVVGTTTIDGDPANIFGSAGAFTVVGPIRQGRILTLSGSNLTLEQITELATHVHRQALEHEASQPQ